MKVLLSCGVKSNQVLDLIQRKFESSGDEIFTVEYIEDIANIFNLGNYFDKAIITDQSINRDYTIQDEFEIRRRLNEFSHVSAARRRQEEYVFLNGKNEIANMIYEETLDIQTSSVIVVEEPPYSVKFLGSLITADISMVPNEKRFHPAYEESNTDIDNEDDDDLDLSDEDLNISNTPTFEPKVVGSFDDIDGFDSDISNGNISNELQGDFGTTVGESNTDLGFDTTQTFDNADDFGTELDTTMSLSENTFGNNDFYENSMNGFDDIIGRTNSNFEQSSNILDEVIPNSGESFDEFGMSGDLPDYTEQADEQLSQDSFDNMQDFGDTLLDDGFDTTETENMFSEDDYKDNKFVDENYDNDAIDDGIVGGYMKEQDYIPEEQPYVTEEQMYIPDEQQYIPNDIDYIPDDQINAAVTLNDDDYYDNAQTDNEFDNQQNNTESKQNSDYNMEIQNNEKVNMSAKQVAKELKPFAARGNNICVTGCGGCGTSTVAYNIANTLASMGYTVLLVDFDTENRTQNYISSDNYNCMDADGANLMAAVNSNQGINTHVSIAKRGLHLLTMGIAGDTATPEEILNKDKIARFINLVKPTHNFVVYDVPFDSAVDFLQEAVYLSDNLVLVTEMNTHGIIKTMLKVCNISSQDMQDTFFSKAQIVFNKYRGLNRLLGKKVKVAKDITKIMDDKVIELVGQDNGLYFSDMHIAGILNDDPEYEYGWFEKVQYSDTAKGKTIFTTLVDNIITHKN